MIKKYFYPKFKIISCIYSCIILYSLMVASPIRLAESHPNFRGDFFKCSPEQIQIQQTKDCFYIDKNAISSEILGKQIDKANIEIQSRIEQEATWFQLKYSLLGTLLISFLTKIFLETKKQEPQKEIIKPTQKTKKTSLDKGSPFKFLTNIFESPATSLVLNFSIIISATIDTQIRFNRTFMIQLGLWISTYIEPLIDSNIVSWESFLRLPGGYHLDPLSSSMMNITVYILTLLLFAIYLFSSIRIKSNSKADHPELKFTFWLMQGCILFSTISGHLTPPNLWITPFPLFAVHTWRNLYIPSPLAIPIYLFLCFHFMLINYWLIFIPHHNITSFFQKEVFFLILCFFPLIFMIITWCLLVGVGIN